MLLHYPAQATNTAAGEFACGAHKDRFTHFTILANTPGSSGLEAQAADGSWYEVPPLPGAFIVNVGSVLELFSNGVFTAPVHRVVNPSGCERYSAPFLRGSAPETLIRPLVPGPQRFSPIRCADYMSGYAEAFKSPQAGAVHVLVAAAAGGGSAAA